jgi:hypothetical protein
MWILPTKGAFARSFFGAGALRFFAPTESDSAWIYADGGGNNGADCSRRNLSLQWNFQKNGSNISCLHEEFHHDCVLFVQHLSENGSNGAFVRRSVVACAELFMDVDRATEGGIPRSSR